MSSVPKNAYTPLIPADEPEKSSADILETFRRDHASAHGGDINLSLRASYRDLLHSLGEPHLKLPPVFHVAGTNGKGSTCAFLRTMLEAKGYRVHVYTSPHLVHFHERIRIAGSLIDEGELVELLKLAARLSRPGTISYFEAATAVAFAAFARHPADYTILEVGLGGRLDATNVIEKPLASLITRLSYDHRDYLGDTLRHITYEKAGIMREGIPCFAAAQPEAEARVSLKMAAEEKKTPLIMGDEGWSVEPYAKGFHFKDASRTFDLPKPGLLGHHQYQNAGLAIAALSALSTPLSCQDIALGLRNVEWPARLEPLKEGALARLLPLPWELWLDGGHNDSAGEVLAQQAELWRHDDGPQPRPLYLIVGMLATKWPAEFLTPLVPCIDGLHTVPIPCEPLSFSADQLAEKARWMGIKKIVVANDCEEALQNLVAHETPGRILICGSLYLAGSVLEQNRKS